MSSGPHLALATAVEGWAHDDDAPLLVNALEALGAQVTPAVWDDASLDWSTFDLVVVRSTWDYTARRDEFLAWAERVEAVTRLENPAAVLRWNTDKHYLGELAAAGLAVAPTTFLVADDPASARLAADPFEAVGHEGDIVVKPTVSAGSQDTTRHRAGQVDGAAAHARSLLESGRDVMVQPYLDGVDKSGETGMVFLHGELSHGFCKAPLLTGGAAAVEGLFAPEQITPRTPRPAEVALATGVLDEATRILGVDRFLYARVDVLPGPDGAPMLLELELTEPSLFVAQSEGAAERAAAAMLDAART